MSWNLALDLQQMLQFHFMQNAFLATAVTALVAGPLGYFVVLRAQTFAAHALSHAGFTGAVAALLLGIPPLAGLLPVGVASALGMGMLEDRRTGRQSDGIAIAAVFTFGLGLGLLFLTLYPGQAEDAYSILFGGVLSISDGDLETISVAGLAALVGLVLIGRPLLFASLDPDVALARGVPTRLLSTVFLALLAFAVAEAIQVVGTLLIFALVVTPAATAQLVTARPARAIALSTALALLFAWVGIFIAFYADPYSVVGFYVTTLATGAYLLARATSGLGRRPNPFRAGNRSP